MTGCLLNICFLPPSSLQADVSLVNDHEPQRSLDDAPDAKQLDSRIQGDQNSDGVDPDALADKSGLQDLPHKNTSNIDKYRFMGIPPFYMIIIFNNLNFATNQNRTNYITNSQNSNNRSKDKNPASRYPVLLR